MTNKEYQEKAMRTRGDYSDNGVMSVKKRQLMNAALGLSGEAGEVNDHIKKACFHGHSLEVDEIKDELGDVLWYIALMCDALGLTLDDVMEHNIAKLQKRYPDGFNQQASREREV